MLNMKQAAEQVLVLAEKKGLKDVDVVVERSESLDVEIQEGKVEKVEQSTSLGLGVRVLDGGRTGLASTERLSSTTTSTSFTPFFSASTKTCSAACFIFSMCIFPFLVTTIMIF
jgi:hypothetical protein